MSTVRGKAPIELSGSTPTVIAETYNQLVVIRTGGWCGTDRQHRFEAIGRMEVHCAKNLIRELRRALRQIRDETRDRLDKAVSDAEGPL